MCVCVCLAFYFMHCFLSYMLGSCCFVVGGGGGGDGVCVCV